MAPSTCRIPATSSSVRSSPRPRGSAWAIPWPSRRTRATTGGRPSARSDVCRVSGIFSYRLLRFRRRAALHVPRRCGRALRRGRDASPHLGHQDRRPFRRRRPSAGGHGARGRGCRGGELADVQQVVLRCALRGKAHDDGPRRASSSSSSGSTYSIPCAGSVLERMEEIAVLKAVGVPPARIQTCSSSRGSSSASPVASPVSPAGSVLSVNVNGVFSLVEAVVNGLMRAAHVLLSPFSPAGGEAGFAIFSPDVLLPVLGALPRPAAGGLPRLLLRGRRLRRRRLGRHPRGVAIPSCGGAAL